MHDDSKTRQIDSEELFKKFMYIMCDKESEKTYRLKSSAGEGIMRTHGIAPRIEMIYSELEAYYPSVRAEEEAFEYIEIMYMLDGHAEFEMENRRIASADKGDICLFYSRMGAKESVFGEGGIRAISIVFELDALREELNRFFNTKEFTDKPLFDYVIHSDSVVTMVASEMLKNTFTELISVPEEYGEYHRKLLTMKAILALVDGNDDKSADYRYFSGDASNKVHSARKLLGENIASDLSVEELADLVKLNRTTLQRVFKQIYGVTIFEYRTRIRMQEAKNLLLDDTLTITEISVMCGYTNASKFSAAFKKNFGITPKEWRRSTDYREEM